MSLSFIDIQDPTKLSRDRGRWSRECECYYVDGKVDGIAKLISSMNGFGHCTHKHTHMVNQNRKIQLKGIGLGCAMLHTPCSYLISIMMESRGGSGVVVVARHRAGCRAGIQIGCIILLPAAAAVGSSPRIVVRHDLF